MPTSTATTSRPSETPAADRKRVLLMIETSMAFGRGVLEGISRYLVERQSWSVQLDVRELLVKPPEWLDTWDGDGIITRSATPEMAAIIRRLNVPVVNLTDIFGDQDLPSIWNDHAMIGKLAADHLVERGFKHFAYCGFSDHDWSKLRHQGFVRGLSKRTSSVALQESAWSEARSHGWETQRAEMVRWLQSLPKPVGVMACNDLMGQHVLEACRSTQMKVPDDVAVIGVDNDRVLCNFCEPPLTSVMPAAREVGIRAAEMLDQLMRGEALQAEKVQVPPLGIVTRQSTDVLAIDDAEIVQVLQIIRDRACGGLTVGDILAEVPIARSVLERRFRKFVGRSPQAEIRSAQLKRACQLLRETELSLAQISGMTGFKHSEYFSVVFKRELGQTPGSYRISGTEIE